MQTRRITYDHKRRLEAVVRSDLLITNKQIAYLDLENETVSFITNDVPIEVLKDIVRTWDANIRASKEAFPETK